MAAPNSTATKNRKRPSRRRATTTPPSLVLIDSPLDGDTGVSRTDFTPTGTVQPASASPKGYLYNKINFTRYPAGTGTVAANVDSYGNWSISFGTVPAGMAGSCYLKVYLESPDEPASDMISFSFAP
jgi:hypothetical protein